MSVEFRSKSHRVASRGISETTLTGRRFAAMLTGGAAALALILATAIPARADKKDDLTKALIAAVVVGVIANELKGKDRPAPTPVPVPLPEPVKSARVPSSAPSPSTARIGRSRSTPKAAFGPRGSTTASRAAVPTGPRSTAHATGSIRRNACATRAFASPDADIGAAEVALTEAGLP